MMKFILLHYCNGRAAQMPLSPTELRQFLERLRLDATEFRLLGDLTTDQRTKEMLESTTANLSRLADQLEQFIRAIELLL